MNFKKTKEVKMISNGFSFIPLVFVVTYFLENVFFILKMVLIFPV